MLENIPATSSHSHIWVNVRNTLYVIGMLALFLFALDLMVSSLQHLGKNVAETIIMATSNPFTGLFIGLLITAIIQSSSATTALVVALVASGSITLVSAVPIIMGANVGTTITSTIVSLGFINKKKEFKRAVAAGTYHDFFNILTVIILFPLEYYYGVLSSTSSYIAGYFFKQTVHPIDNEISHVWPGFTPVIAYLTKKIAHGFILTILSFVLLFTSIILFRKFISKLLLVSSPNRVSRLIFKNQFKSFLWGLGTTAAIRSSTVTTSLVVPLVANKVVTLRKAAPFILGANIGTTITAFIAVTLNTNTAGAISIAIAHFLFNCIGVIIFFPIPFFREIPIKLAKGLGKLTLKYRLVGLVYILLTFFFIPFSLIYLNQGPITTLEITYEKIGATKERNLYTIVSKMNTRNQSGEWLYYTSTPPLADKDTEFIFPVLLKNNVLFARKQLYFFNKPGFCWDGEDENGKYKSCIVDILSTLTVNENKFDSVYVYRQIYYKPKADSVIKWTYISAPYLIIVKKEAISNGQVVVSSDKIVSLIEK